MSAPAADTYRTLRASATAEVKVDGSRFVAEAHPAGSEARAGALLDAAREREHQATHHCWAYRLGPAARCARSGDDGEPTGTAGPPILRQIEARDLTGVLVVVTRYFGGTKLGTGGLARAYGQAAAQALEAAPAATKVVRQRVQMVFDYDDTGRARRLVERFGAVVEAERYGQRATLEVGVPRSQVQAFRRAFRDATAGRGESRAMVVVEEDAGERTEA